jgi:hypothetical protein
MMWSTKVQVVVLPPFRGRNWRGILCVPNRADEVVAGDTAEEVNAALTHALGAWLAACAEQQALVHAAASDFTFEELSALGGSTTPSEAFARFLLLPTASRWSWLWSILGLSHAEIVTLAGLPPDARGTAIEMHKTQAFGAAGDSS